MRFGVLLAALALLWSSPPTPASAADNRAEADDAQFFRLLRNEFPFSKQDVSVTLRSGEPVAIHLPARQQSEVGVAGVEQLNVPLQFFLNSFRNRPAFEHGQEILRIHEFSKPPVPQDLQMLALEPSELHDLSVCTPGNCAMKLSASMMEQMRMEQMRGGAVPSIEPRYRQLIFQLVTRYLNEGNSAMIAYADKKPVVQSLSEFRSLLSEFDWLSQTAPPLYHCLADFSGKPCPQIDSFLYWTSARFGLKPVFSITQTLIYRTVKAGQPWALIAFKQVYADHYLNASLGLAVLAEQPSGAQSPTLRLLYVNRYLSDAFGGWLGGIKKSVARERSVSAVQKHLLDLKATMAARSPSGH